jgi:hypothetical protein
VQRKYSIPYCGFLGLAILGGTITLVEAFFFFITGANNAVSGYGFDFGAYAILPGIVAGTLLGIGITASFPLWQKALWP